MPFEQSEVFLLGLSVAPSGRSGLYRCSRRTAQRFGCGFRDQRADQLRWQALFGEQLLCDRIHVVGNVACDKRGQVELRALLFRNFVYRIG